MTEKSNFPLWRPEYFEQLNGESYVDLNVLMVAGALELNTYERFPRLPQKEFVDNTKTVRPNAVKLISQLIDFLRQYRAGGRTTILNSVWSYLVFQEKNKAPIGTENLLDGFFIELKSRVETYQIKESTAQGHISNIQNFLVFNNSLVKSRHFTFKQGKHFTDDFEALNSPYTNHDFKNIVNLLMDLYECFESVIDEHLKAWQSGYRNQLITDVPVPTIRMNIYDLNDEVVSKDVILGNFKLNHFFIVSLLIFALFTWGNTTQINELRRQDIKIDEDGSVDTDFIFKGRGSRFVRLSIGKSEVDGSRSGLRWFRRYISIRERLVSYLSEVLIHEDCDYLFPYCKSRNLSKSALGPHLEWDTFTKKPNALYGKSGIDGIWDKIKQAFEQSIPKPLIPKFRKTAEQMTDAVVQCPFTIMEKSQHSWETYRNRYAKSNPKSSLENISKALDYLLINSENTTIPLNLRQKVATENGLILFSPNISNDLAARLPNGLGCQVKQPPSDIERKFLNSQHKMGREPKVCADLSNCVYCPKSCVIDTTESVYQLLSFREVIRHGKPTWIGSQEATLKYEELLQQIELRLKLVSPQKLTKASEKLRRQGPAGPWSIS